MDYTLKFSKNPEKIPLGRLFSQLPLSHSLSSLDEIDSFHQEMVTVPSDKT